MSAAIQPLNLITSGQTSEIYTPQRCIGILIILYQKYHISHIYLSIYLISTLKNIRRYIQKNFIVADGKRNGCGVPTTPPLSSWRIIYMFRSISNVIIPCTLRSLVKHTKTTGKISLYFMSLWFHVKISLSNIF